MAASVTRGEVDLVATMWARRMRLRSESDESSEGKVVRDLRRAPRGPLVVG